MCKAAPAIVNRTVARLIVVNRRTVMRDHSLIGAMALAAALWVSTATAQVIDLGKYPDFMTGQWKRPPGAGIQWDPSKPPALGQQAPLIPEYQAMLVDSLKDQVSGGQGLDTRITCITNGMPRMMTFIRPVEFIVLPAVTYIHFENVMPKDEEPTFVGYSIGKWIDEDRDGKFDVLEVETRNFKGPRTLEMSGLPLHTDNQTIVKERIYLDKANKDLLHNEITIIDHAFTRPWTVMKNSVRETRDLRWFEDNCAENNNHVIIGKENYFLSADGMLMPARRNQTPPDLRYFRQTQK
jgi:hypothetical protein